MIGGFAISAMLQEWIDQGQRPSVFWQVLAYLILTASEVMVSITALEFAYTQSPRKMKSFVMAVFLVSVAVGNFFTMGVNRFIQVPDQSAVASEAHEIWYSPKTPDKKEPSADELTAITKLTDHFGSPIGYEKAPDGSHLYKLAGPDKKTGTSDDVQVVYDANGLRQGVVTSENQNLLAAEARIQKSFKGSSESLPGNESGTQLLADINDAWGKPLQYRLVNRSSFRVTSLGADGEYMTPDDFVLNGSVTHTTDEKEEKEKRESWLDRRNKELASIRETAAENAGTQKIEVPKDGRDRISAGGQTKLEGAEYFWFFTKLMAATAVCFVVVGLFYKPRVYLQEEE